LQDLTVKITALALTSSSLGFSRYSFVKVRKAHFRENWRFCWQNFFPLTSYPFRHFLRLAVAFILASTFVCVKGQGQSKGNLFSISASEKTGT
jgi:hypothetical protein